MCPEFEVLYEVLRRASRVRPRGMTSRDRSLRIQGPACTYKLDVALVSDKDESAGGRGLAPFPSHERARLVLQGKS